MAALRPLLTSTLSVPAAPLTALLLPADAADATAGDAEIAWPAKLGWLANHMFMTAAVAPLMADEAASAATAPCVPAGKASVILAVDDPGTTSTVTAAAPGNRVSIAFFTATLSVAPRGLAKLI